MDLALYLRVLWRFRIIVAAGFVIAVLLAFFAVEKVSFSNGLSISPRKGETWKSDAFLQITGPHFPLGRDVPAYTPGSSALPSAAKGDPQRLSYLTTVFAQLATGDAVIHKLGIDPTDPVTGTLAVTALAGPAYSNPAILNILDFTATGPTPQGAARLARRASMAFQSWLLEQQRANAIRPSDRVLADVYKSATPPVLVSHSGRTLPIIVFLTVFGTTMGLALVLENVRPRPSRARENELHAEPVSGPTRQTA